MLRWAERNGLVGRNPIEHVARLPETEEHKKYKRRALSEDEITRFLAASEADDEDCALIWNYERVPQSPMWLALLETGARYGELRQATWGDVDFGRGLLTLRAENTKARKKRVIPLRAGLLERLRALRVLHETIHGRLPNVTDHVFLAPEGAPHRRPSNNANRVLRRLLERAGIERVDADGRKIDVHSLRHTFASRLARSNVSLFQAQKLLGHSDPKLTSRAYAHVDAEDLRPAIDALPEMGREPAERQGRKAK
jgi:integrase